MFVYVYKQDLNRKNSHCDAADVDVKETSASVVATDTSGSIVSKDTSASVVTDIVRYGSAANIRRARRGGADRLVVEAEEVDGELVLKTIINVSQRVRFDGNREDIFWIANPGNRRFPNLNLFQSNTDKQLLTVSCILLCFIC